MTRTALFVAALTLSFPLPALPQSTATPATGEKPPAVAAPEQSKQIGYLINQRPLPTAKDARAYAEAWLQAAGMADIALGNVRTAGGLYVVDLRTKAAPKALSNQLLLRKQDGYAVLVYPAARAQDKTPDKTVPTDPQREAAIRNAMAGMSGMSGMSGGRGIYGGTADANIAPTFSVNDFLIRTPAEAATAAKLWLFQNGVRNVKVGAVKEQGGIYVGQVVAKDSGATRNQFVIRRADGFIAMVNPIKFPPPTKPDAPQGTTTGGHGK